MSVIKFENHHDGNTTYIADGWCVNGCQHFSLRTAAVVFKKYDVSEQHRADVLAHLSAERGSSAAACIAAVEGGNGYALAGIPKELRTVELCAKAFYDRPNMMYWIPEELRTSEMYLQAVLYGGVSTYDVPPEHRSEQLYIKAINYGLACLGHHVPTSYRTEAVCLAAVAERVNSMRYVPTPMLTPEFYVKAVQHNFLAIKCVPFRERTAEMCLAAIAGSGDVGWVLAIAPKDVQERVKESLNKQKEK